MGEQGKRLLLAVALALGVMMLWNMIFPKEKEDPKPKPVPGQVAPVGPIPASSSAGVPLLSTDLPVDAPWGADETIVRTFPDAVVTFTSRGGAIKSWKLTDKRYASDHTKGELIPAQEGAAALQVNFANSNVVLPKHAMWTGEVLSDTQVRYSYKSEKVDLVKTFTIEPSAYLVRMTLEIKLRAAGEARQILTVSSYGFQDPASDGGGGRSVSPRVWESATLRDGSRYQTPVKSVTKWPRMESKITWTGFEHPFLLAAMAPVRGGNDGDVAYDKHTYIVDGTPGLMQTDLHYPLYTFKPGDAPVTRELVAYFGPKNYESLEHADDAAGFSTGFKKTIDLGMFRFIGRPLLWLMHRFYDFTHNWGIAIILLTLLVKLATLYWTTKSMRSMKAMASLAPKMKELQEKYKDDKARQQQETMALYKNHGVSPLAGCLPILLQMPIWLALYRMLSSAGELYLQPFIPGWIDDLTNTDPYHVLPVLVTATMFLQSRMTPPTGDAMQQKIMMYLMPLMFGVMGFFFPAGLSLYIFTNTCLSALHSLWMKKYDKSGPVMPPVKPTTDDKAPKGGKAAAKPVIDVEATEAADGDDDGGDDDTSDEAPKTGAASNRSKAKRKPRRR